MYAHHLYLIVIIPYPVYNFSGMQRYVAEFFKYFFSIPHEQAL